MTNHGGKRAGAGAPRKISLPGEQTKVVRIPVGRVAEVREYLQRTPARWPDDLIPIGIPAIDALKRELPFFAGKVPAGFPSPAQDYAEGQLDLNEFLVEHEAATYFVQVEGNSMVGAGILPGDIVAIDRSLEPRHGQTVLAVIDGNLTLKELYKKEGVIKLLAHNPDYPPIEFRDGQELTVWGVMVGVVRKTK